MKTRIFLIAMLLSVAPFLQSAKAPDQQQVFQKLVWIDYCGNVSAGCSGGPLVVKIASNGTTAYLVQVTSGGIAVPFYVHSIVPTFGPNVFAVNFDYQCPGEAWQNYNGGAYTLECQ
ncbi:hypothetical protein [Paraflavitalea speifideaquila]|uniref:hypothetical protein n=1 Tax=Paraflavitalea speifideaquila TaxID=3076558 RepID=UPI0028ECF796|nr:hypothetical protein [Paraflavitalea speifideiaquila]